VNGPQPMLWGQSFAAIRLTELTTAAVSQLSQNLQNNPEMRTMNVSQRRALFGGEDIIRRIDVLFGNYFDSGLRGGIRFQLESWLDPDHVDDATIVHALLNALRWTAGSGASTAEDVYRQLRELRLGRFTGQNCAGLEKYQLRIHSIVSDSHTITGVRLDSENLPLIREMINRLTADAGEGAANVTLQERMRAWLEDSAQSHTIGAFMRRVGTEGSRLYELAKNAPRDLKCTKKGTARSSEVDAPDQDARKGGDDEESQSTTSSREKEPPTRSRRSARSPRSRSFGQEPRKFPPKLVEKAVRVRSPPRHQERTERTRSPPRYQGRVRSPPRRQENATRTRSPPRGRGHRQRNRDRDRDRRKCKFCGNWYKDPCRSTHPERNESERTWDDSDIGRELSALGWPRLPVDPS
jgi:hypothetical protein